MKLHIKYSKKITQGMNFEFDPLNSNRFYQDKNNIKDLDSDSVIVEFLFRNNASVNKFLDVWQEESLDRIDYNFYKNVTQEDYFGLQKSMNETILSINNDFEWNIWKIDENLMLNIGATYPENSKLNSLHKCFEDIEYKVIEWRKDLINAPDKLDLFNDKLEKINYLVHKLERGINDQSKGIRYYTVIRKDNDNKYILTDDDYNLFSDNLIPGVIYADYGTVGKCLEDCFHGNDLDLVKKREVKQQKYLKPYVNFSVTDEIMQNSFGSFEGRKKQYYQWCANNNLQDYIDYNLPMYNLGRLPLADLYNFTLNDMKNIFEEYEFITGVYIE